MRKIRGGLCPVICCVLVLSAFAALPLSGVEGAEMPGVFPAGTLRLDGNIESFRVLQTLEGRVWLFLAVEGKLKIFRVSGGEFAIYGPENFGEIQGEVRSIEIFDAPPFQYAAVAAREESGETLHILAFDGQGEPRLLSLEGRYPSIDAFALAGSPLSGAAVYVLSGGTLECNTETGAEGQPWLRQIIGGGAGNSGGTRFDLLVDAAFPLGAGWLSVPRNGGRDVVFFSLGENTLLHTERAGFFEGDVSVETILDREERNCFAVFSGENFSVWRIEEGRFPRDRKAEADSALQAESGLFDDEENAPPGEGWRRLFSWGPGFSRACFFLPQDGALAAGEYRNGVFTVLRRRSLLEEGLFQGLDGAAFAETHQGTRVINGQFYAAFRAGREMALCRFSVPGGISGGDE